jgi:hypothetical protein
MGDFQHPDGPAAGEAGTTPGTGDRGEKWDPVNKRWIPLGEPGNIPRAAVGEGGWSNNTHDTNPNSFGFNGSGQPNSTGKTASPGAWGGYSGRMVDDGKGGVVFDPTHNGRQDAVDHLEGLGAAAANREAYRNDYSEADRFAGAGQDDRGFQVDAMNLSRDTAQGKNLQSQILGQRMLAQGVQAQQAGAASTRGGALAAAAAGRQQAAGQGAFTQAGNAELEAQRAADMARGRDAYMGQATGLRASDATAQGLNQAQTVQDMRNELDQRNLNQTGQMGYDEMAQDTSIGAANAAVGKRAIDAGAQDTSSNRHQGKLDQGMGWVADGVSTAGSFGATAAGYGTAGDKGYVTGSGGQPAKPPDPYSNSDARTKAKIHSMATAALARRGAR